MDQALSTHERLTIAMAVDGQLAVSPYGRSKNQRLASNAACIADEVAGGRIVARVDNHIVLRH